MRTNLENPRIYDPIVWGQKFAAVEHVLAGAYVIPTSAPNVMFFDANGSTRTVSLPAFSNSIFYVIANVGTSGIITLLNSSGATVATIFPGYNVIVWANENRWVAVGQSGPGGGLVGVERTLTGATETVAATDTDILINRVGDMTLTLPTAASRAGIPVRIADVSTPSPDHTVTLARSGSDTIQGATTFPLYHNGTDAPRAMLWPYSGGRWIVM